MLKKTSKIVSIWQKINPRFRNFLKILLLITWVCGVYLLVSSLLSFPFRALYQSTNLSAAAAQTIYSAVSYLISLIIIIFLPKLILPHFTISRSELGLHKLPTWIDIGLAPVGLIVYLLLASVITNIFSGFSWFNLTEAQDVGFSNLVFGADRYFALVALVLVAPIAEELMFRGFLYSKLKKVISKFFNSSQKSSKKPVDAKKRSKKIEWATIIISTLLTSLAFAAMHGQWNVGINVFAMSIVLCIMREITGTIYSGILLHMIKNGIAFYLLYIIGVSLA